MEDSGKERALHLKRLADQEQTRQSFEEVRHRDWVEINKSIKDSYDRMAAAMERIADRMGERP